MFVVFVRQEGLATFAESATVALVGISVILLLGGFFSILFYTFWTLPVRESDDNRWPWDWPSLINASSSRFPHNQGEAIKTSASLQAYPDWRISQLCNSSMNYTFIVQKLSSTSMPIIWGEKTIKVRSQILNPCSDPAKKRWIMRAIPIPLSSLPSSLCNKKKVFHFLVK